MGLTAPRVHNAAGKRPGDGSTKHRTSHPADVKVEFTDEPPKGCCVLM